MAVDIQSYLIGHLGIVAGVFDSLNIAGAIDGSLPKKSHRSLPHSVVIKAMILNGLGLTRQRLYLFPNFFKTTPTENLLGEGIAPYDLNDDIVGRTLDAIHKYGSTELFNEITLQVIKHFSLGTQLIHADTTNFSLHGRYEGDAPDGTDSIRITFGHAKDGRTELKRFVLGLVTNQHSFPLFAKAYSGNESDKKRIMAMKRVHIVNLKEDEREKLYQILRNGKSSERSQTRARILLLADEGLEDDEIVATLKVSKATVCRIRKRYCEGGLDLALNEKPRIGAPKKLVPFQTDFSWK